MKVYFVPASNGRVPQVIDEAIPRLDGNFCGRISGKTIEQFRERYPTIELGDVDVVIAQKEAMLRSEPTPCTKDQYFDALVTLPPLGFTHVQGYESFKMEERFSGRMTNIYVRATGGFFYSFMDVDTLSHADIIARVKQSKHFGVKAVDETMVPA
jgi:hypothetical protein